MSSSAHKLIALEAQPDEIPQPVCPTCEQPIAHEQVERIRQRIEEQEQAHLRELETLRSAEREAAKAELDTQLAEARQVAEARLQQVEDAKAAELTAARQEATNQAHATSATQLAEVEEKAKVAQAQVESLMDSHEKELAAARQEATTTAQAAAATQLESVEAKHKAAEQRIEELQENQETVLNERLAEQREALESDKVKAVNVANASAFADKQKLEERVAALQRELEGQSARELGEGAEIDLYESLRQEFPDDKITRVKDGEAGADVIHEIMDNGKHCGTIVYDSKNRKQWRNSYPQKLRDDQIAAKADHAILTSHKFPAGHKQLYAQDGVVIVNPARAVAMASILRKHVIQVHSLRLSTDAREQKMVVLYDYINSEHFHHQLEKLDDLANDLFDLDVKEEKAHQTTWTRRGAMLRSVQRAYGDITNDIDRIIAPPDSGIEATG
jgi:hypothetical protein